MSGFSHYDFMRGVGSFSTDRTVQIPHPSELPENKTRTELYNKFHQIFAPEMRELFQVKNNPMTDYEKAWLIFLGVEIDGQMYFACHIAEDFTTSAAYNCCDPNLPCPTLLFGQYGYIPSFIMNKIREQFPVHHKENLPYQAAFGVTLHTTHAPSKPVLFQLFDDASVKTKNCEVSLLPASGTLSLSFKKDNFPFEYWSHLPRTQVIHTALENELKLLSTLPDPNSVEKINCFEKLCNLEKRIEVLVTDLKKLGAAQNQHELKLAEKEKSKKEIEDNTKIPPQRKTQILSDKKKELGEINQQLEELKKQIAQKEKLLDELFTRLKTEKKENFKLLPHSYRESTFQIAFEVTLTSGETIYKQYNGETGYFEMAKNADKDDTSHPRYSDSVHNPYSTH